MTRTAVCCLWEGHDLPTYSAAKYNSTYVANLAAGLGPDVDLSCYVDGSPGPPFEDVADWRPFQRKHRGGWSRRLEPMAPENRPRGSERHVLLDLDTIVVGDCEWLWEWDEAPIGAPRDPWFSHEVCSTVITYNEEGARILWDAYREGGMMDLRYAKGRYSEMALLRSLYRKQPGVVGMLEPQPEKLLSYKVHVKAEVPWHEASLVYFHGNPKPHDLPAGHALRKVWSSTSHV